MITTTTMKVIKTIMYNINNYNNDNHNNNLELAIKDY